jgi:hypothetical protein
MPIWNYDSEFFHIVTIEKKIILGLHILFFKVMFPSKNVVASMARKYVALKDMQQENSIYPNMASTLFAPLLEC